MRSIATKDAIGLALCHDITEIRPGECKHVAFQRGHVVREEDVAYLLRLGKENLYIWEDSDGLVHEDDAANCIAKSICGENIEYNTPQEGRINFYSTVQGLLTVDISLLNALNSIPNITIATAHSFQEVSPQKMIAGTRVIPLAIQENSLIALQEHCKNLPPLLNVIPFQAFKVGLIITGSEVYTGRIQDGFTPVLQKKFSKWQCIIHDRHVVSDNTEQTIEAIHKAISNGADFIALTGGMSVDPDDRTPLAIKTVADEVVTYGAPIFPGAMFMLAYKNHNNNRIPIVGLPGCVMYNRASIFDLIMPKILARQTVTKQDFLNLAHGGLCESCPVCHYPNCAFGKRSY